MRGFLTWDFEVQQSLEFENLNSVEVQQSLEFEELNSVEFPHHHFIIIRWLVFKYYTLYQARTLYLAQKKLCIIFTTALANSWSHTTRKQIFICRRFVYHNKCYMLFILTDQVRVIKCDRTERPHVTNTEKESLCQTM